MAESTSRSSARSTAGREVNRDLFVLNGQADPVEYPDFEDTDEHIQRVVHTVTRSGFHLGTGAYLQFGYYLMPIFKVHYGPIARGKWAKGWTNLMFRGWATASVAFYLAKLQCFIRLWVDMYYKTISDPTFQDAVDPTMLNDVLYHFNLLLWTINHIPSALKANNAAALPISLYMWDAHGLDCYIVRLCYGLRHDEACRKEWMEKYSQNYHKAGSHLDFGMFLIYYLWLIHDSEIS